MMEKLCAFCKEKPRHVSQHGKELTRCQECLQLQWRTDKEKHKTEKLLRKMLIASRLEAAELRKRIRELEGTGTHDHKYVN